MKVLFLPETTVRLKNLTSHTRYLVCISAFNAAGDGPRSRPSAGRTHQAGTWPPQSTGLVVAGSQWGSVGRAEGHCCLELAFGWVVILCWLGGKDRKTQPCGKGSRGLELEQMVGTTNPFAGWSGMQLWGSLWDLCYHIWKSELVSRAWKFPSSPVRQEWCFVQPLMLKPCHQTELHEGSGCHEEHTSTGAACSLSALLSFSPALVGELAWETSASAVHLH